MLCYRISIASLLIAFPLAGCAVISGSSKKAPTLNGSEEGEGEDGGSVADKYDNYQKVPVQLKNMERVGKSVDEQLTKLEEGIASASITSPGRDISAARQGLTTYYAYGHKGGDVECEICKNHPKHAELVDAYDGYDERLRKLEEKYTKCTYGYKMSDEEILKPTYEWDQAEWKKIESKAAHKTGRCWLHDRPDEYYMWTRE